MKINIVKKQTKRSRKVTTTLSVPNDLHKAMLKTARRHKTSIGELTKSIIIAGLMEL